MVSSAAIINRWFRVYKLWNRGCTLNRSEAFSHERSQVAGKLMALPVGTKLGRYEVQSRLGSGGMGEVYRAKDMRLGRDVAVKILPHHLSSNPDAIRRLEMEARAISALNDANICTLYDVGHQDGVDFIVMEFLQGETLQDRLRAGPLLLQQACKYGCLLYTSRCV